VRALDCQARFETGFFHPVTQWTAAGVSVNVAITEGALYKLGKVELIGEDLPVDAMRYPNPYFLSPRIPAV